MKDNPKVESNGGTGDAGTLEVLVSLSDKKINVRKYIQAQTYMHMYTLYVYVHV